MERLNTEHLAEKARQAAAYLDGDEAIDPNHPEHATCIYRALDRARDIAKACEEYLDAIEEADFDAWVNEPTPEEAREINRHEASGNSFIRKMFGR